jgi:ketosteroid isomerase-like protein
MASSSDHVREIFKGLETGDGAAFFEHVADDVDWTVLGTHPLAGHYLGKKAFREGTFAKLGTEARLFLRTENDAGPCK